MSPYFPFPNKKLASKELERDLLFDKIPVSDRQLVVDDAWEVGVTAARNIFRDYGKTIDIYDIAEEHNLKIVRKDIEKIIGRLRYYSEYLTKDKTIILYMGSINKWATYNHLQPDDAEELILSHEFFHHLEHTSIGEISQNYKVPTLKIGKRVLISSGIKALSEIGSHGFAYTYWTELHNDKFARLDRGNFTNISMNVVDQSKLIGNNPFDLLRKKKSTKL